MRCTRNHESGHFEDTNYVYTEQFATYKFLDLAKAFDCMFHGYSLVNFLFYGIGGLVSSFVESFVVG